MKSTYSYGDYQATQADMLAFASAAGKTLRVKRNDGTWQTFSPRSGTTAPKRARPHLSGGLLVLRSCVEAVANECGGEERAKELIYAAVKKSARHRRDGTLALRARWNVGRERLEMALIAHPRRDVDGYVIHAGSLRRARKSR